MMMMTSSSLMLANLLIFWEKYSHKTQFPSLKKNLIYTQMIKLTSRHGPVTVLFEIN